MGQSRPHYLPLVSLVLASLLLAAPLLAVLQIIDTPPAYRWMDILMTLVYIIVLVVWIYAITRRDAIKGLLVITPVAILSWFPVLEFIPNEIRNPLQFGMLLITGLAAVAIVRSGSWRVGIWTIIGSSMLAGAPIAYFRTYHHNIPPGHADASTVAMLTGRYAQAMFWSAMLVIAPLLIWFFWELSKRCGREGRLGYRLAFSGLLLNLISNLVSDRGYSMGFILRSPLRELAFSALILLSAAIYVVGVILLLRAAREEGLLQDNKTAALFFFAALGLPLMFMFPMFEARRYTATTMPFGLFYENNVPDLLVYGLGALWLLAGGWLITRMKLAGRPPRRPAGI